MLAKLGIGRRKSSPVTPTTSSPTTASNASTPTSSSPTLAISTPVTHENVMIIEENDIVDNQTANELRNRIEISQHLTTLILKLTLHNCQSLLFIFKSLVKNQSIKTLVLYYLNENEFVQYLSYFERNTSILHLTLNECALNYDNCCALFDSIARKSTRLLSLNVNSVQFDTSAFKQYSTIAFQELKYLSIYNSSLVLNDGATVDHSIMLNTLLEMLIHNASIEYFYIHSPTMINQHESFYKKRQPSFSTTNGSAQQQHESGPNTTMSNQSMSDTNITHQFTPTSSSKDAPASSTALQNICKIIERNNTLKALCVEPLPSDVSTSTSMSKCLTHNYRLTQLLNDNHSNQILLQNRQLANQQHVFPFHRVRSDVHATMNHSNTTTNDEVTGVDNGNGTKLVDNCELCHIFYNYRFDELIIYNNECILSRISLPFSFASVSNQLQYNQQQKTSAARTNNSLLSLKSIKSLPSMTKHEQQQHSYHQHTATSNSTGSIAMNNKQQQQHHDIASNYNSVNNNYMMVYFENENLLVFQYDHNVFLIDDQQQVLKISYTFNNLSHLLQCDDHIILHHAFNNRNQFIQHLYSNMNNQQQQQLQSPSKQNDNNIKIMYIGYSRVHDGCLFMHMNDTKQRTTKTSTRLVRVNFIVLKFDKDHLNLISQLIITTKAPFKHEDYIHVYLNPYSDNGSLLLLVFKSTAHHNSINNNQQHQQQHLTMNHQQLLTNGQAFTYMKVYEFNFESNQFIEYDDVLEGSHQLLSLSTTCRQQLQLHSYYQNLSFTYRCDITNTSISHNYFHNRYDQIYLCILNRNQYLFIERICNQYNWYNQYTLMNVMSGHGPQIVYDKLHILPRVEVATGQTTIGQMTSQTATGQATTMKNRYLNDDVNIHVIDHKVLIDKKNRRSEDECSVHLYYNNNYILHLVVDMKSKTLSELDYISSLFSTHSHLDVNL